MSQRTSFLQQPNGWIKSILRYNQWRSRNDMTENTAAHEFDWVTARARCSLANEFLLIHESPLTDALFLLVSKSDEVTTT